MKNIFTKLNVTVTLLILMNIVFWLMAFTSYTKANEVPWQVQDQEKLEHLREEVKLIDQEIERLQELKKENRSERICLTDKLISESPANFKCWEGLE